MKKYIEFIKNYINEPDKTIKYYNINEIKLSVIFVLLTIASASFIVAENITKLSSTNIEQVITMSLLNISLIITIGALNSSFLIFITGLLNKTNINYKKTFLYAIMPVIITIIATPIAIVCSVISNYLGQLLLFLISVYQIYLYFKAMKINLKISIVKIVLYLLIPYCFIFINIFLFLINI